MNQIASGFLSSIQLLKLGRLIVSLVGIISTIKNSTHGCDPETSLTIFMTVIRFRWMMIIFTGKEG